MAVIKQNGFYVVNLPCTTLTPSQKQILTINNDTACRLGRMSVNDLFTSLQMFLKDAGYDCKIHHRKARNSTPSIIFSQEPTSGEWIDILELAQTHYGGRLKV